MSQAERSRWTPSLFSYYFNRHERKRSLMAVLSQPVAPASWREPDGIAPRGTLVLIPGRGEQPVLYTRFGRRDRW